MSLVVLTLWLPDSVRGADPLLLSAGQGQYDLTPHLDVLLDPGGNLSVTEVASPEFSGKFTPHQGENLYLVDHRAAYWVRFCLSAPGNQFPGSPSETWLLEVGRNFSIILDYVDFYIPLEDGLTYLVKKTGARRPPEDVEPRSTNFLFEIPEKFSPEAYFYLRLETEWDLSLQLTIWSAETLRNEEAFQLFGFGAIYGILACMILYNFFLFISLRDRSYFYYVLYIASGLLWQFWVRGHYKFLAGQHPGLDMLMLWLMVGSVFFFGVTFTRACLMTKTNAPRIDKLLAALSLLGVATILASLAGQYKVAFYLSHIAGVLIPLACIVAAFVCLVRGYMPAIYYLVAWFVLIMSGLAFALMGLKLLPVNFVTVNGVAVGLALESILLSLALADRIRRLRMEREAFQKSHLWYRKLSVTDGLTGLYNKRFLINKLADEVELAHSFQRPLSTIIIDLDDFKLYNDNFGHTEADKVLVALGEEIRGCVRESDSACRFGGEEFTIIMPGVTSRDALAAAERIRSRFTARRFTTDGDVRNSVTISLGLAQLRPGEDAASLMARADKALYEAKKKGKNRTIAAE